MAVERRFAHSIGFVVSLAPLGARFALSMQ
jgi:hypothetical protein